MLGIFQKTLIGINLGIIGNISTVAPVGRNRSIDWYCLPTF